jgi:hypothetical protein
MGVIAAASRDGGRSGGTGVKKQTCIFVIGLHAAAELATGVELALAIVKELGLVLGVTWRTLHDAAKASAPDTGSSWRVKRAASIKGWRTSK